MPLPKYGPPGTPEYRAYQKEWRRVWRLDPDVRKKESRKTRKWQLKNPEKFALGQYRRSARRRGIENQMSDIEMLQYLKNNCFYCGAEPNPLNGIDRVDNSRGYVDGNVVTACRTCNLAKGTMTLEEFKQWALRLATRISGDEHGRLL